MDTPALLPCPFCGGTASLDCSVGGFFVECDACEARGPFVEYEDFPDDQIGKAEQAAAAAWNQRSAWQPIETAPRDGRDFIAYNEFTGPYITAAKAMPPR
jgi:Lar family restriction alleviation protein